jgi:hypothetical protein
MARWSVVFVSFVCVVAAAAAQSPKAGLTTIAKGDASGQQLAKQVTVRSAAEWKTLWKEHAPTDKMPDIDFTTNMVVGIFLGTKPSAGHGVEIVNVRTEASALIVEYVQTQPAKGTMSAQILTEPFHLVTVPLHAGTVRFVQFPDTKKPVAGSQ